MACYVSSHHRHSSRKSKHVKTPAHGYKDPEPFFPVAYLEGQLDVVSSLIIWIIGVMNLLTKSP